MKAVMRAVPFVGLAVILLAPSAEARPARLLPQKAADSAKQLAHRSLVRLGRHALAAHYLAAQQFY